MSNAEVLVAVANGSLSPDDAAKLLVVSPKAASHLTCKAAEKGGVSVYGLNVRFPITLYADQWERLATFLPDVLAFIKAHPELLRKQR